MANILLKTIQLMEIPTMLSMIATLDILPTAVQEGRELRVAQGRVRGAGQEQMAAQANPTTVV